MKKNIKCEPPRVYRNSTGGAEVTGADTCNSVSIDRIKSSPVPLSSRGEGFSITRHRQQTPVNGGFEIPLGKEGNRWNPLSFAGQFILAALLTVAGPGAVVRADNFDPALSRVLAGIERYYEGLSSLTARFEQVVEVPVLEKLERYRGNFYFQKPDFVRLEYTLPKGQLMVADGSYYWFFQPQEDIPQAMRAPMDEVGTGVPRYVLGGDLARRFEVSLVGRENRGGKPCHVLDLVPREATPYYSDLRAWVDAETFATRAVRYEDDSGNFNTFDLSELRENVAIEPDKFKFSPPPGTQLLEADR